MSREQAAPKRGASERAQRRRRSAPAALGSFASPDVSPAPRAAGMRPTAIAAGRRQDTADFTGFDMKEAA